MGYFENIKVEELFRNDEKYRNPPFSDEELAQTAKAIGWKLPKSYVALLKIRNGGRIDYEKYEDCWLAEIYGITPRDGLIEMFDNWINEWEYPNIGIPFGQTESAGHDMYFMDFGSVDENGEPRIVLVDNECDNCVTEVAKNLEEFLTKIYNREEV